MGVGEIFSIDQNCHPLWDVIPKLHALAGAGHSVRHFIEDVDVAFTAMGAGGDQAGLQLARERYYGSGGGDWGAAMFYSEFLSRLPVELRHFQPMLGMKLSALARKLGRTVDDMYDEFSPGDNWQLIGPSYVGDREHHRLIGDVAVSEVGEQLVELMDIAERDMRRSFPADVSQRRLDEWFVAQRDKLSRLMTQNGGGKLVDLYRAWMSEELGESVALDLTSSLVATGSCPAQTALLNVFVRDYGRAAQLYADALAETDSDLRPLRTAEGELPMFAVIERDGHLVRTGVYLVDAGIRVGDRHFPLAGGELPISALLAGGVQCLAGKALLLVMQARLAGPLALPYQGSLYMPAAAALEAKLTAAGLLTAPLHPLVRVRFRLLDRLASLATPIHLPTHLAGAFGCAELPAGKLAAQWRDVARAASDRLTAMATDAGRLGWQRQSMGDTFEQIDAINVRRRELAKTDAKSPALRQLSHQAGELAGDILSGTLRQVADDWQVSQMDYWDSRGAIMPWCIALGGREFYDEVIARAEMYHEPTSDK